MSKRIKIDAAIGEKVDPSEAEGKEILANCATPVEGADVEAQSEGDWEWHLCPYCGAAGIVKTNEYTYYNCYNCRCIYRT